MLNEHGYYSERGQKAASKFSRLKALLLRRQGQEQLESFFVAEAREDGLWIRPRPRFGKVSKP